jgi:hypothetical protein
MDRTRSSRALLDEARAAAVLPDRGTAAHDLIGDAEKLARLLRVVTGGHLDLAVTDARTGEPLPWKDAHLAVGVAAFVTDVGRARPRSRILNNPEDSAGPRPILGTQPAVINPGSLPYPGPGGSKPKRRHTCPHWAVRRQVAP